MTPDPTPLFVEHAGVKVYRVYMHRCGSPWKYWFSTDRDAADYSNDESWFDARQLTGKWDTVPRDDQWEKFLGGRDDNQMLMELIIKGIDEGAVK